MTQSRLWVDTSVSEDEPGVYLVPNGRWAERADAAEWVGGDYFLDYEVDQEELEGFVLGAELAFPAWVEAGLQPPIIGFVEGLEEGHLARFVDGTEDSPVVVVDFLSFSSLPFSEQVEEGEMTLRHEAGHALLRSMGIEYSPEEEDLVEEAARHRDLSLVREAAE
jgi:hypothetical protein